MEAHVKEYIDNLLSKDNFYKGRELQIEKLGEELGLVMMQTRFTDPKISGAIYKDTETGKFCVYVNKKHASTRKRFTIAHEIGHYISAICNSHSYDQLFSNGDGFEDYAVSYRKDGQKSSLAETEANEIAAYLLMKEEWVKEFVEAEYSVEEMAEKFFVSQQAVAIRLERLGINLL